MRSAATFLLPTLALLAAPAHAQTVVTSPAAEKVAVTIYRAPDRDPDEAMELDWLQGYALVTEQRTVDIPAGRSTIRFEGVAGGMQPESALVSDLPTGAREKNLDADLLSPASIYARSLGRPVILRRTEAKSGKVVEERAVVRSGPQGAAIVQTRDGFLAADCGPETEELVYSELPPGLSPRPTLSVEVDSPIAQRVTLSLSYLAWGFDWQSNYVLHLDEDGRHGNLNAWVTLASSDATSFPDAETAVVGGKANRTDSREAADEPQAELEFQCFFRPVEPLMVSPPAPPMMEMADAGEIMVTATRVVQKNEAPPVTVVEEGLGDLRLYRVPIPTTVAARAQKQVALFDGRRIETAITYVADFEADEPSAVGIELRTHNRKQEGLGLALPGGRVAIFAPQQGESLLVGEGSLTDKAVGEDIEIPIGAATQVTVDANSVPRGLAARDIELTVTNANPWPVSFEGRIRYDRESNRFEKVSAKLGRKDGFPLWQVRVPANGTAKLRYRLTAIR
jgi:hypothetical protein